MKTKDLFPVLILSQILSLPASLWAEETSTTTDQEEENPSETPVDPEDVMEPENGPVSSETTPPTQGIENVMLPLGAVVTTGTIFALTNQYLQVRRQIENLTLADLVKRTMKQAKKNQHPGQHLESLFQAIQNAMELMQKTAKNESLANLLPPKDPLPKALRYLCHPNSPQNVYLAFLRILDVITTPGDFTKESWEFFLIATQTMPTLAPEPSWQGLSQALRKKKNRILEDNLRQHPEILTKKFLIELILETLPSWADRTQNRSLLIIKGATLEWIEDYLLTKFSPTLEEAIIDVMGSLNLNHDHKVIKTEIIRKVEETLNKKEVTHPLENWQKELKDLIRNVLSQREDYIPLSN